MSRNYGCSLAIACFLSLGAFSQSHLKINQLQIIGSHNSYKKAIDPKLFSFLAEKDSTGGIFGLQYEHISIPEQLDLGLRNLEIDVYPDAYGGRFVHPKGLDLVKEQAAYDDEKKLGLPGFKMIHIPDYDFRTHYYLLVDCLNDLRVWSEAHPEHTTIFITLEPKDSDKEPLQPFNEVIYNQLDSVILNVLGRKHLILPDDVRGTYATLEEAVLNQNWPTVEEAKGKFMFILDAKGEKMNLYLKNHSALKDRVIFVNAPAGTSEAAAMIINDPNQKDIPELVKKGYIIRTRADANTRQARNNDDSDFEAARKSGAQIITTDYYLTGKLFETSYQVRFEDGTYERINPVNGKK